ncbi:MAG: hypothetical protein ACFB2Z_07945 [Maricaulaceae bacterium]
MSKLALCSSVFICWTGFASAQDAELEERVRVLEDLVRALAEELELERADIARLESETQVMVEELTQSMEAEVEAVTAAVTPGNDGFRVGDVRIAFGGLIDLDVHVSEFSDGAVPSGSVARDFYIPSLTPVGGASSEVLTDFTSQASRFFLRADRTTGGHRVAANLELDFLLSAQGTETVSNSFAPRLRLGYFDFDNYRFGQDWTTFQNTSAIPESASFLVASDGMVFVRQPVARAPFGGFQIAVENGDTTVTTPAGGRIEADEQFVPDLIARYNWRGDFGNVSFGGILRQLRGEVPGVIDDDSAVGWGLSASGRINTPTGGDVRFNVVGGEGVGRYVGLNAIAGAFVSPAGQLDPIPLVGGFLALRQPLAGSWRFNVGYSGLFADNPELVPGSVTQNVQSAFLSVLTDLAPRVTVGGELLFGRRELGDDEAGDLMRFTFSTKYAF